jgi:hypothetical protein
MVKKDCFVGCTPRNDTGKLISPFRGTDGDILLMQNVAIGTPNSDFDFTRRNTVKTLEIYRHSLKDGKAKNTVGPKGLALAKAQGDKRNGEDAFCYEAAFHGVEVRTAQTLLAFISAADEDNFLPEIMPAVEGFGSDALFADMLKPPEFRDIAKGVGTFRALLTCHPFERVKAWAEACYAGLVEVFAQITEGEVGLAISHSPTIELALWHAGGFADLTDKYAVLKEMEGVLLEQDDDGVIKVVEKIAAPVVEEAK